MVFLVVNFRLMARYFYIFSFILCAKIILSYILLLGALLQYRMFLVKKHKNWLYVKILARKNVFRVWFSVVLCYRINKI
ncbi:hypothetical protein SAMN02982990_04044 [Photorhabdus luminescens]|uniref:Uncharacterized protein n=1 Tax=Photorhabdus luminescens TaxID=29488 RepID=A0A1G5REK9_PHOLU|nr:hypothetical protein SAMN02982990_04044 [Photorhabdus luminescens]